MSIENQIIQLPYYPSKLTVPNTIFSCIAYIDDIDNKKHWLILVLRS